MRASVCVCAEDFCAPFVRMDVVNLKRISARELGSVGVGLVDKGGEKMS